jgi:hypothetical protein
MTNSCASGLIRLLLRLNLFDSVELVFRTRADDKLTLFDFIPGQLTSSHAYLPNCPQQ